MGGYENIPGTDNWAQVLFGTGDAQNPSRALDQLNNKVGRDVKMFQHGGNDEYWANNGGRATPGNTKVGERFIIADPSDGRFRLRSETDLLRIAP